MAKKLISYDDEAEGLGLPEVVEQRLDDKFGGPSLTVSPDEPAEFIKDGEPVVWIDTSGGKPVTLPAPTINASSLTVPEVEGVEWAVDGVVLPTGLHPAPHSGLAMVQALPVDGHRVEGRSQWITNFDDRGQIVVDDFTGAAGGTPLTGRETTTGGLVWGPPIGTMEGFPDDDGLTIYEPPGDPARATYAVPGGGSHNTLDLGFPDYRITFWARVHPSNNASVGVNVRCDPDTVGESGIAYRWRWWNTHPLRFFRRTDGVSQDFSFPDHSGLWEGDVEVVVLGNKVTAKIEVGNTVFTDEITYNSNLDSGLIRLAAGMHSSGSNQPVIENFKVEPL